VSRATVVLIHGPCVGPWIWHETLVPHLESLGLRCFTPDLHEAWPAPGWSPAVARIGLARYVDRLHTMLAHRRGPTVLIGHSLGARVVEGLIARGHRDGAVLVSPTPPEGLDDAARVLAQRHPAALARALLERRPLRLFGAIGDPDRARVREWLLGPRAAEALVERVALALRDEPFVACRDWLRAAPVPVPASAPVPVPVLVVSGRDDALVTPAALRRTAAAWKAVAHVLPHAGHCPMLGPSGVSLARQVERWLFER
jgi:pimeloyl-ACP methyl ester carboxylesterase